MSTTIFRFHLAIGGLVCVLVPGASYLHDGSGRLAYTMFASTEEHRVEIQIVTAVDGDAPKSSSSSTSSVSPSQLAPHAGRSAGVWLMGAESWIVGPLHRTPRSRTQLEALADLTCAVEGTATKAKVTLFTRTDRKTHDEQSFIGERECSRR